jgi:hypothetical protein
MKCPYCNKNTLGSGDINNICYECMDNPMEILNVEYWKRRCEAAENLVEAIKLYSPITLASEESLKKEWLLPEEDEAWKDL